MNKFSSLQAKQKVEELIEECFFMESQFLPIRRPPENVFSISKLKEEFRYLKDFLLEINSTWRDVQELNSFSHCIIGRLSEEEESMKPKLLRKEVKKTRKVKKPRKLTT